MSNLLSVFPLPMTGKLVTLTCFARVHLLSALTISCTCLWLVLIFIRMYLGYTEQGIKNELESTFECAQICTKLQEPLHSLATMETAVLKLASTIPNKMSEELVFDLFPNSCRPAMTTLAKGLLPYLELVSKRDRPKRPPNALLDPKQADKCFHFEEEIAQIDPYGNTDFSCKICFQELSNAYFQCVGCWNLLKQDYNICISCYDQQQFYVNHADVEEEDDQDGEIYRANNAKVNKRRDHKARRKPTKCNCPVTKGHTPCDHCQQCPQHQCACHTTFKHHLRFYSGIRYDDIIANCRSWCDG